MHDTKWDGLRTARPGGSRRDRGSVLIFVVAVFVLLIVIATAYLTTSRASKNAAQMTVASANMGFARDAMLSQVQGMLYDATLEPDHAAVANPQLFSVTDQMAPPSPHWLQPWGPGVVYQPTNATGTAVPDLVFGPDGRIYVYVGAAATPADVTGPHGPPPYNTVDWFPLTFEATDSTAGHAYVSTTNRDLWAVDSGGGQHDLAIPTPLLPRMFDYRPPVSEATIGTGTTAYALSRGTTTDWDTSPNALPELPSESWLVDALAYNPIGNIGGTGVPRESRLMSRVTPHRLNPVTNQYDTTDTIVTYGGNSEATTVDPTVADAYWNYLPYTSGDGTHYRYAMRIIDSSRMVNLNTAFWADMSGTDTSGLYLGSVNSAENNIPGENIFVPANGLPDGSTPAGDAAQDVALGRNSATLVSTAGTIPYDGTGGSLYQTFLTNAGAPTLGMLGTWQNRLFNIERMGGQTSPDVAWYGPTDELELRAYGGRGTGGTARASAVWPHTLAAWPLYDAGGVLDANNYRQYYTTYSFDRDVMQRRYNVHFGADPDGDPSATGHVATQGLANLVTAGTAPDVAFTRLANLLYTAGYSENDAITYAINYLGQASNLGGQRCYADRIHDTASGQEEVVLHNVTGTGPFTDNQTTILINNPDYVLTGTQTRRFVPFRAQPFINEAAVLSTYESATDTTPVKRIAVEVCQSYSDGAHSAIDLTGWRFTIQPAGGVEQPWVTDLGTRLGTTLQWGFAVFSMTDTADANADTQLPLGTGTVYDDQAAGGDFPAGMDRSSTVGYTIRLQRPIGDPLSSTPQFITVDEIRVDPPAVPTAGTPVHTSDEPRANYPNGASTLTGDPGAGNYFLGLVQSYAPAASSQDNAPVAASFGDWNPLAAPDANFVGVSLEQYDRFAVVPPLPADGNQLFANVGSLNAYPRYCIREFIDTGAGTTTREQNLDMLTEDPAELQNNWYLNATPALFASLNTTVAAPGASRDSRLGLDFFADPRAQRLADMLSTVARHDDGTDEINGTGGGDTPDEVRLPGRINVNTAPEAVLATLPFPGLTAAQRAEVAHCIVLYRDRRDGTGANEPQFATNGTMFPGYGIHNLSDLMIPIYTAPIWGTPAQPMLIVNPTAPPAKLVLNPAGPGTTFIGMMGPGSLWTTALACCTVRSDTFVVYGYMEAVKQHPLNTGGVTPVQWYGGGGATITDDPNAAATLLRTARKRFVAIVDRSWSNYPRNDPNHRFVLPKIVAYRELPY